jgi:hypothetical protein
VIIRVGRVCDQDVMRRNSFRRYNLGVMKQSDNSKTSNSSIHLVEILFDVDHVRKAEVAKVLCHFAITSHTHEIKLTLRNERMLNFVNLTSNKDPKCVVLREACSWSSQPQ